MGSLLTRHYDNTPVDNPCLHFQYFLDRLLYSFSKFSWLFSFCFLFYFRCLGAWDDFPSFSVPRSFLYSMMKIVSFTTGHSFSQTHAWNMRTLLATATCICTSHLMHYENQRWSRFLFAGLFSIYKFDLGKPMVFISKK